MAENKKNSVDEDILRYVFDSRFFPESLEFPFDKQSPVVDAISKARNYESARNIILNEASNNPEFLEELRDIASFYKNTNKDNDDSWIPENTFVGDLTSLIRPIDAESIQDIEGMAESIAQALGYDEGWSKMYKNVPDGIIDPKAVRLFIENEIGKKVNEEKEDGNEKERRNIKYRLGYSDESDDDYMLDNLSKYISRAIKYKLGQEHPKEHPYGYGIGGFLFPNIQAKHDKGLDENAIDVLADLGQWVIGGAATKSALGAMKAAKASGTLAEKVKPVLKPAAMAGGSSGILGLLHDVGDSLMTKHVYSEGEDGKEISKRGDAMAVLSNWPDYAKQSLASTAIAIPLLGASAGAGALAAASNALRSKVGSAIDFLVGNKNVKNKMANAIEKKNVSIKNLEDNTKTALEKLFESSSADNTALKNAYKRIDELESNPILKTKGRSTEPQRREVQSKIDKAKMDAERLERKIKGNDIERNSIYDYKNRAMQHIMDNFDPKIAELERVASKNDAIPSALFYLANFKDMTNNEYEKKLPNTGLRLLGKTFGVGK